MHIEILVEELSAEAALKNIIPKIIPSENSFDIHPYQGKKDLLDHLLGRLKGYSYWLPHDWRIMVIIDEDRQNCLSIKQNLEEIAIRAGLRTKSSISPGQQFQIVNRITCEELEAWFFGDINAIKAAYPKVPDSKINKFRGINPDAILNGTWETLEKLLKNSGYYPYRMPKIEVARKISANMNPGTNRSNSFRVFKEGLLACI